MTPRRHRAILLLGPTGSGKTPLGDLLERRGLWQMRCTHFDFGAQLRQRVAENAPDHVLNQNDLDFLRNVLHSGALLQDQHFPLAERILKSFLRSRAAHRDTVVVLNGLPRHIGQAKAMDALFAVQTVLHLSCPIETIVARIRSNVGGDRKSRQDDDPHRIQKKLAAFQRQTLPLLAYYQGRGVRIETVDVTAQMTPKDAWQTLDRIPRPAGTVPKADRIQFRDRL